MTDLIKADLTKADLTKADPIKADDAFLDRALAVAHAAADAAADVIAQYYRRGFEVETKADETPVTVADREAEAAIKRVLRTAFPDHAYYGEEEGREGEGDHLWLIDPIDGTKSFVRGYPMFSTQIALMVRGELVAGVSNAPAFGERAFARRGGGAWFDGERVSVSAATDFDARTAISFGNVKTLSRDGRWQALATMVQRCGRTRGYGDFYHYHLLARGAIDLVVESDLNILDIAPLVVLLREAGAVVTDLEGAPIGLATTSILAGPPALHARALAEFQAAR